MTTTRRTRRLAKLGSSAAGLGLAVVAVLGFSNAAFNASVDNESNNWAAQGALDIDLESSVDAPLFSFGLDGAPLPADHSDGTFANHDGWITDLGVSNTDDGVRDIQLTYTGDPSADVRMFVSDKGNATGDLDQRTLVTVTRTVGGVTQTIHNAVPLSDMPGTFAAAGQANRWLVPEGTGDRVAVYNVSLATADASPEVGTVRGVVFTWEAQQA